MGARQLDSHRADATGRRQNEDVLTRSHPRASVQGEPGGLGVGVDGEGIPRVDRVRNRDHLTRVAQRVLSP